MTKKYAIKVQFPDEDKWTFVIRPATVLFPEEVVMTFDTRQGAIEYAKTHNCGDNAVVVKFYQDHDTWYDLD